jgi:hypothetical protein
MRTGALALVFVIAAAGPAAAEWQITPSFGISFGGGTTFLVANPETDIGSPNAVFGVRGTLLGEVFGIEGDLGLTPGFFQRGLFQFGPERFPQATGEVLEVSSNVTTLTGNVVVAVPRRLTEYGLRPYAVGGLGMMRVRIDELTTLSAESTLAVIDVGGGVTGFLTDRIGLNWDFRRFFSVAGDDQELGFSLGDEQLSFWRASMGLVVRF